MYPFRQESDVKPQTLQVFTFCLNIFTAKYNLKYIKCILNDGKWSYLFSFLNGYYYTTIWAVKIFKEKDFLWSANARHCTHVTHQDKHYTVSLKLPKGCHFVWNISAIKQNLIYKKFILNHGKISNLFSILNGYYFYQHFRG